MPERKITRLPITACLALGAVLMSGCVTFRKPPEVGENNFARAVPADYPRFGSIAHKKSALLAARESIDYLENKTANPNSDKVLYKIGDREVTPKLLLETIREFVKIYNEARTDEELQRLIAEKFDIYQAVGTAGDGKITYSSYFEPIYEASPVQTAKFKYPIYRKPDDLVEVDLAKFDEKLGDKKFSSRVVDGKLQPYPDREQIDLKHLLKGKSLEIAWFKDKVEIMDLQIEGSARLNFPDGRQVRAHYAGTNSLEFKGWITTLVKAGVMEKEGITHSKAKQYLQDHPEIKDWILATNKRYTFFELLPINDPEEGPPGTFGRQVVAEHSIAVDPKFFPLGALGLVETSMPDIGEDNSLLGSSLKTRFVFCQDTGGAIKGKSRIDYFAGTGPKAGALAGNMWSVGKFFLPILKVPQ
jgi:membrane-bound lytic murein transglycosylase A